jgi:flagellar motor switch protein FliN
MPDNLNPSQDELDKLFGSGAFDDNGPLTDAAFDDNGPISEFAFADQGPAAPTSPTNGSGSNAPAVSVAEFSPLSMSGYNGQDSGIDLLLDISLQISVELGRTRMTIGDVLALRSGSVIELDKLAGEPADILVNGTLIARGEVVVVDEKFGVRVIEVVSRAKRLASIG